MLLKMNEFLNLQYVVENFNWTNKISQMYNFQDYFIKEWGKLNYD